MSMEQFRAASVEDLLKLLTIGTSFETWDAHEMFFKRLQNDAFMPLAYRYRRSIESQNKMVILLLPYLINSNNVSYV